ncbi:MAG: thioesterase family protein [Microthrixaceae bacterium]
MTMSLTEILTLTDHGPDTFVAAGPRYPWGGLYGGQIVAQALLAAADSVPEALRVHSLRAYFIRRGDHEEPVRYEIDRIRDGRSFATRRVVARQAIGAILNLEASFQRPEPSVDLQAGPAWDDEVAALPRPDQLQVTSWTPVFERATVPDPPVRQLFEGSSLPHGRSTAWLRTTAPVPGPGVEAADLDAPSLLLHFAALAFMSDDMPTDAVVRAHPVGREPEETRHTHLFAASLDHTIWFHRPVRADRWQLHDVICRSFVAGRGLVVGQVHDEHGVLGATIAQEVLLRDRNMAHDGSGATDRGR